MPLSLYYLFLFIGFGALYPLLPIYLQEKGLSGSQIGYITGLGPVMTMLFQPVWGLICDRWNAEKRLLTVTLLFSALTALGFLFADSYVAFLMLFCLVALFNSSGVPIGDSIAISYVAKHGGDYGSLRLWGAIGFAIASFIAGRASESMGLGVIFWIYAGAFVLCVLTVRTLPREGSGVSLNLFAGLKQMLKIPRFLVFLLGTFLIFGTIQANNSFYGLFYTAIGGTLAGVGVSFLIAAGSEAPVMRVADAVIRRMGLVPVLVLAGLISAVRWLWYGTEPDATVVMILLFVQGISVGLYLPAGAQFVRETAPEEMQSTALGIYSAIGNGLGAMAGSVVGGWMLQIESIFATYLTFGIAALVGVGAMLSLKWLK